MEYIEIERNGGSIYVNPRYVVMVDQTANEITVEAIGVSFSLTPGMDIGELVDRLNAQLARETPPASHCAMCCPKSDETGTGGRRQPPGYPYRAGDIQPLSATQTGEEARPLGGVGVSESNYMHGRGMETPLRLPSKKPKPSDIKRAFRRNPAARAESEVGGEQA